VALAERRYREQFADRIARHIYALRATVLRVASDPQNLAALRADPESLFMSICL